MKRLEGRVAVVTGAASGIGLAVAEALAAEGMSVVLADLSEDGAREHAERLAAGGAQVLATAVDVRDPASMEELAAFAVERFGGLHVAVNNAGIVNRGRSWELPLEEWHRVLDVNLWGVVHGVRAFVPRILATGEEGHVVVTGSMATVAPMAKLGPYSVAKHGLLGLADVLRAELEGIGAPVGVSLVMPGAIRTGMNPYGTVTAEQVAANVVDGIRRERPYVFTDDHSTAEVESRLRAILGSRADVIS